VVILPVYAVLVCLLVAKYRRRPLGYVLAALGALLPMLVLRVLCRIEPPSEDISLVSLSLIFRAESGFLLVAGLLVASMPRPVPSGMTCTGCRYDLKGLDPVGLHCPECGAHWRGAGSGHEVDNTPRIPIPRGPIKKRKPHL
jgi:hypothetical protein